eukprot:Tamp_06645.p1 GENE.Tamp_06645~~Tamp_06645.p1  ORF type:complete len:525 (+),score=113.26 Tamp_06645:52-1626(+)
MANAFRWPRRPAAALLYALILSLMASSATSSADEKQDPHTMSLKELREELKSLGATCKACSEKADFADRLRQARAEPKKEKPRIGASDAPKCVPKKSCKEGCDLCRATTSQSKTVCRAISFCEWHTAADTKSSSGGSKKGRHSKASASENKRSSSSSSSSRSGGGGSSSGQNTRRDRASAGSSSSSTGTRGAKGQGGRGAGAGAAGSNAGGGARPASGDAAAMTLFAKASSGDVAAVKKSIEQGLSVMITDDRGATPLHYACWYGHLDTVEVLLSAGAEVDAVSGDGFTPLHLAAAFGHGVVVSALLAKGADAQRRDRDGNTPMQLAARGKFQGTMHILTAHQGQAVAHQSASRHGRAAETCSTRYARLGLCAPDAHTQELLRVEEEEVQRRAQERRAQMEEEELLFQQEEFRRQAQAEAEAEEARFEHARRQQDTGGPPRGHERASSRIVNLGVEASKGMRVRKSAARLAYVEENGWDDLSAGGDGTLISILGDGRQCVVRWDTGSENEYAIGYGGLYDLEAA